MLPLLRLTEDAEILVDIYIESAKKMCGKHGWKPSQKNVQSVVQWLMYFQQNLDMALLSNSTQPEETDTEGKIEIKESDDSE